MSHNFRNDIAWKRLSGGTGRARNKLPVTHDVILFYAMKNFNLNQVYIPLDEKYVSKFYRYSDKRGLYQVGDLTAAGTREGDSGMDWRGISVYKKGKHWNAPNAFPPEVSKPNTSDQFLGVEVL